MRKPGCPASCLGALSTPWHGEGGLGSGKGATWVRRRRLEFGEAEAVVRQSTRKEAAPEREGSRICRGVPSRHRQALGGTRAVCNSMRPGHTQPSEPSHSQRSCRTGTHSGSDQPDWRDPRAQLGHSGGLRMVLAK